MQRPNLPNLDVSSTINPRPDTENILSTPDTQHSTAHLFTSLRELIPDHRKKQVLPVPITHPLLQPQDPFTTPFVLLILPDWPDALFKDVVVRDRG